MNCCITLVEKGKKRNLKAQVGQTIAEVLQLHGINFSMPCGGRGKCGKCRAYINGSISEPTNEERMVLGEKALSDGMRLLCMVRSTGDVIVEIPQEASMQIMMYGLGNTKRGEPIYRKYGVAVDIGTTTLTMQLYGDKGLLGVTARVNPQVTFGADIITRIQAALSGKAEALQLSIIDAIIDMLNHLSAQQKILPKQIDALVITGNTVMLHLLTGTDTEPLSHAPFSAKSLFGKEISNKLLGLQDVEHIYLPRCMDGFVGADITCAVLASGMLEKQETSLLVDIGTNGEMALWNNGKLSCCSTAAGSVFEGAGIEQGSHGISGAIDAAWISEGAIEYSVIGDGEAKSICGSGIIDIMSVLLKGGYIDETGRIQAQNIHDIQISKYIHVTQKDVRMVQLAKSAICAGLLTLLEENHITSADVNTFYIAGGFGSFINIYHATEIGLFPKVLGNCAKVIGNAAIAGAAILLQNKTKIESTVKFADLAYRIDLASNHIFMERYVEHMMF